MVWREHHGGILRQSVWVERAAWLAVVWATTGCEGVLSLDRFHGEGGAGTGGAGAAVGVGGAGASCGTLIPSDAPLMVSFQGIGPEVMILDRDGGLVSASQVAPATAGLLVEPKLQFAENQAGGAAQGVVIGRNDGPPTMDIPLCSGVMMGLLDLDSFVAAVRLEAGGLCVAWLAPVWLDTGPTPTGSAMITDAILRDGTISAVGYTPEAAAAHFEQGFAPGPVTAERLFIARYDAVSGAVVDLSGFTASAGAPDEAHAVARRGFNPTVVGSQPSTAQPTCAQNDVPSSPGSTAGFVWQGLDGQTVTCDSFLQLSSPATNARPRVVGVDLKSRDDRWFMTIGGTLGDATVSFGAMGPVIPPVGIGGFVSRRTSPGCDPINVTEWVASVSPRGGPGPTTVIDVATTADLGAVALVEVEGASGITVALDDGSDPVEIPGVDGQTVLVFFAPDGAFRQAIPLGRTAVPAPSHGRHVLIADEEGGVFVMMDRDGPEPSDIGGCTLDGGGFYLVAFDIAAFDAAALDMGAPDMGAPACAWATPL